MKIKYINMNNIDIIKQISLPLNRFYNIEDHIIFFSQNNVFRITTKVLYAAKISDYPFYIILIKIYDNYLHILNQCDSTIVLDSICLDDMFEYNINKEPLRMPTRNILRDFSTWNKIDNFIIKNGKIKIICQQIAYVFLLNYNNNVNNISINKEINVKAKELVKINKLDQMYLPTCSMFLISFSEKTLIIGPRWNKVYYKLSIANKYDPSVILFSRNIYDGCSYSIIDDYIIIWDRDEQIRNHIIIKIKGPMLESILKKDMLEFCITNKVCIDYEIIYNKDIIICKKNDKYCLITFNSIEEPNNIIDYRQHFSIKCDQYHIICNNICLKISKFYNSVEEIQAITTVFS